MGWKVRYKERTGKYAQLPEAEQAKLAYTWRYTDHVGWKEIGERLELSASASSKLMQRHGYDLIEAPAGSSLKFAARNSMIMQIANDNFEKGISSELAIVDAMKQAGYEGVTNQVVRAVIYRAQLAGRKAPPMRDSLKKRKPSDDHPWAAGPTNLMTHPIPPRTPELLARGRVSWDDLDQFMCRYTPSEDSPFKFCGEPVMAHSNWCRDCYDNIIKRPPEEAAKARRNYARLYQRRNEHQV